MRWCSMLLCWMAAQLPVVHSTADQSACHPCYQLVDESSQRHTRLLQQMSGMAERLRDGSAGGGEVTRQFERSLSRLTSGIERLYSECQRALAGDQSPLELIGELQERIEEVRKLAGSLLHPLQRSIQLSGDARDKASQTETLMVQLDDKLRQTMARLESDGEAGLRSARYQEVQLGVQSERLATIARQARGYAQQQHAQANSVATLAQHALANVSRAHVMALSLLEHQANFSESVRHIETSIGDVDSLMAETGQMSLVSRQAAIRAYERALSAFTAARASLVRVDTAQLLRTSSALRSEADQLRRQLDQLLHENGGQLLVNSLEEQLLSVTSQMRQLQQLHQSSETLLAQCLDAKDKAEAAVAAGERTLAEARRTLATITGFDRQVSEWRSRAQAALQQVERTRHLVAAAETVSGHAHLALDGAQRGAASARQMADRAQVTATKAEGDASFMQKQLSETVRRVSELQLLNVQWNISTTSFNQQLYDFEKETETHWTLSQQAIERAGQAKISLAAVSQRVRDALQQCRQLVIVLAAVDSLQPSQIDALQRRLRRLQQLVASEQLLLRIEEMRSFRAFQNRMARSYEEDLLYLRREVSIIQEIAVSLPDGCFLQIKLEP